MSRALDGLEISPELYDLYSRVKHIGTLGKVPLLSQFELAYKYLHGEIWAHVRGVFAVGAHDLPEDPDVRLLVQHGGDELLSFYSNQIGNADYELLLRSVVIVKRPLCDFGGVADLHNGNVIITVFLEKLYRFFEDPFFSVSFVFPFYIRYLPSLYERI